MACLCINGPGIIIKLLRIRLVCNFPSHRPALLKNGNLAHTHTHTVNKNDDSLDTAEFQSAVLFYFHRFAGWPLFSKLDKFRPPEYVCHCGARWGPIYLCQLLPRRFGSVARHDRKKIPNR